MKPRKTVARDYIMAALVLFVAIGLLTRSGEVSKGIAAGLETCAGVLIPALFPFMALSGLLSATSAARVLSMPLKPVTTKIFKLPEEFGSVILLSLIGGYPVGAKNVSQLVQGGKISTKTAERMMCFCMNPGPSFLITAVGVKMLNDKTAGLILFLTQTAATIIIGIAVSYRKKAEQSRIETGHGTKEMRGAEAFVEAVTNASSAMLAMCAFAVIFSGILPLAESSGAVSFLKSVLPFKTSAVNAAVSGFFEVTSGCMSATGSESVPFGLLSAIVSFGGLSVLFQMMSCFHGTGVSLKPLIISRVFHALLAAVMAAPLYRIFCESKAVFSQPIRPVPHTDARSFFIAASLLCMCAILTVSMRERGKC